MTHKPITDSGLGYFNLARGLGMLLIRLGHSITPFFPAHAPAQTVFAGAGSVLGGGIMAMFFLSSGFGFYTRSPKKCLSIQKRLLLKPYCLTTAAILATKLLLALIKQRSFAENGGELVLTYLLGLNAEGGGQIGPIPIESVSILWFILALFGGWIICNSIFRLKDARQKILLTALCVAAGYGLTCISKVWPYCLPMMLLCVGYLAAGSLIQRHQLLTKNLPLWCWAGLLAVTCFCAAFGNVNMVACQWKLGLLDVAGSFCVGFLLMRLYHRFMQRNIHNRLTQGLEAAGFYSVWIVFLHGYEKVIIPWYRLGGLFPNAPGLAAILCLMARCAVMYAMVRLLNMANRKQRRKRRKAITLDS